MDNAVSGDVFKFRVYNLWGVMDKHTGEVLIPAKYGDIYMVSESVISCNIGTWSGTSAIL